MRVQEYLRPIILENFTYRKIGHNTVKTARDIKSHSRLLDKNRPEGTPVVPVFSCVKNSVESGTDRIEINLALFKELFKPFIEAISVDENWYEDRYPDVRDAIRRGEIASATQHYRIAGYYENRFPRRIVVDDGFYISQNIDVARGIATGEILSCQAHFETYGFVEGRLPFDGWRL
jgi:hypothetical protein